MRSCDEAGRSLEDEGPHSDDGGGVKMKRRRTGSLAWTWLALAILAWAAPAAAQQIMTQPAQVISVARGTSALIRAISPAERVALGDPAIADAIVMSPTEILVNGLQVGTTSLLVWDRAGGVTLYTIEVSPDIGGLERQVRTLFPHLPVRLTATGDAVVVSGEIRDALEARRVLEIVRAGGVRVINNLVAPSALQVLLHVRIAEVNRTAIQTLGSDLFLGDPHRYGEVEDLSTLNIETLSSGLVRLFLLGDNGASLEAVIRALRSRGEFRSLAEPNLVAMEGEQATFLAGGEFPFPSVSTGATERVVIEWKEFGVRLNFTPWVTNDGRIRLNVSPEVSALDFANGLQFAGYIIPAILTRRASTDVELRPGQHLAIAGLLDNQQEVNVSKIPLLGDLPIIGTFFSMRDRRDRQTELLVIVTPHIVQPSDAPPAIPPGEPADWERHRRFDETMVRPETGRVVVPPSLPQRP
jgi:pilus assembly protein CpaC